MLLDLDQTIGERFQFFTSSVDTVTGDILYDKPDGDGWVVLRSIQPFLEERIVQRKRVVEHVFNPKTRSMERVSDFAELTPLEIKKEQDNTWDYAIVDFGNFKDNRTGNTIICDRENKLRLMKVPVFERFIAQCLHLLSASKTVGKEEQEKN